ncbi:MAG: DUF3489 domain-containing protein [Novosphingobium sp.]|jgi:hypothetical protein|uniref:DUF3489 domain-containing protein n=1 Tax=Novosphingobium sp. TaxID=1874826 RepID=UPI00391A3648
MPRKMAREPKSVAATPKSLKPAAASADAPAQAGRKIDQVLILLRRESGATLVEMTDATGWLPHSARAVLTGLRKKGYRIERRKRDAASCYHLLSAKP